MWSLFLTWWTLSPLIMSQNALPFLRLLLSDILSQTWKKKRENIGSKEESRWCDENDCVCRALELVCKRHVEKSEALSWGSPGMQCTDLDKPLGWVWGRMLSDVNSGGGLSLHSVYFLETWVSEAGRIWRKGNGLDCLEEQISREQTMRAQWIPSLPHLTPFQLWPFLTGLSGQGLFIFLFLVFQLDYMKENKRLFAVLSWLSLNVLKSWSSILGTFQDFILFFNVWINNIWSAWIFPSELTPVSKSTFCCCEEDTMSKAMLEKRVFNQGWITV